MEVHKSERRGSLTAWKTADGRFFGVLIDPVELVADKKDKFELPAAALLSVPRDDKNERATINKYSPVIATAPTTEELAPLISAWADRNAKKTSWDLRDR